MCGPSARSAAAGLAPPPEARGLSHMRARPSTAVLDKATNLRNDSSKYAKNAKYLNTQAMLRKYGPIAFVVLIVFAMLWWRFR